MTFLKRLRIMTAVLGVAGGSAAVVTTLFGDVRGGPGSPATTTEIKPDGNKVIDELAVTKFSQLPALTYQVRSGETLFAWQIKPTLEAAPVRPRDFLIMVDTSASQAGKPLQQARQIISALSATLTADDRVSIWTLSTPAATRALTQNFQPADSEDVKTAAIALTEVEYGSGATDLKVGLQKALATLSPNPGRHQMVLFLGDGESTFDPLTEDDRIAIGTDMDSKNVFFFAVPLGIKVNPANLHGLATLTGGTVIRVQEDLANQTKRGEFLARLNAAIEVPVLKTDKLKFGDEVTEFFPTKLPPLRTDKSTLVMGKLAKPAAKLTASISGKSSGGKAVTLALSQVLPASQAEHFFLKMMIDQWSDAPHKDAPAMLQADRALALASTQVKLYREEFLTQANWAVTMDRLDEAAKLFGAAQRIDPNDGEANAGILLVNKMKTGLLTRAELEKRISAAKDGMKLDKEGARKFVIQEIAKQQDPPVAQPAPGGAQPPAAIDRIREAETLRRVEEQRYRVLVDSTIRRARQQLRTEPDQAYLDLKRQRDEILAYGGIGDESRTRLTSDITSVMDEIFRKGAEIKRQAAVEREQIAKTRQQLNEFDRKQADEDRTKARIDSFKQLMQQARFELAYQEAQILIQERIAKGQSVPPTATASSIIGQQATQLREWRELVRIREDRFLLAMMQTEKSHIPYPDEPPVHFPPAAVWRELTGARKERYENSILGPEASPTQKKLQSVLDNQRISYEKDLKTTPFTEVIEDLAKRYDITFVVNKTALGEGGMGIDTDKAEKLSVTKLDGMPVGTFLDVYLRALKTPFVTYIVRPDYIEITSYDARMEEKVTRVFPVADLVIPIPQAVNQQSLFQNLGVQQQTLAIFGQASLYGGALQNFVGGNNNNQQNQPGAPGGGGGAAGGGNPFFGGGQGGGGGLVGLGGGGQGGQNVGQFGNLGGQFGLQGGTQERLLIQIILDTVAKGEWEQSPQAPPQNPNDPVPEPILPQNQRHSIGYYPPARALIVRGSSRYMGAGTMKLKKPEGGQANALPNDPNKGVLVIGPNTPRANPAVKPTNNDPVAIKKPVAQENLVITGRKPTLVDPKFDEVALMKKLSKDPKRMWHEAIDWTVTDPGLIVAVADFLMDFDEFGHAAEVLKANLRKGLATDDWAHEALAVALQMSKADSVEVERAALSAIDLDPTNPKAYLKAAKVEADLNNHDLAVRFCQRAAEFGPDQPGPYANALAYAKDAKNVSPDTVAWAATNLLQRDWPMADGIDYHAKTRNLLPAFVSKFQDAGVKADGVRRALIEQTQRDLVIELLWQGAADLDLTVAEPTGSVCNATSKRTTAGGVLKADIIEQADEGRAEIYTAASAFGGTYKVSVKSAFGRAIGNTATIKVTRFKGTPKESHDLITVDLANPKTVEIKLAGGSRTELAAVTADVTEVRLEAAAASLPASSGIGTGIGGGFGLAGSTKTAPVSGTSGSALPNVAAPQERVLPGMGSAADIRASYKLNADRQSYSIHMNPVFANGGKDVKLPKVPLLPGSEK